MAATLHDVSCGLPLPAQLQLADGVVPIIYSYCLLPTAMQLFLQV
jgi:hypothetical protein